MDPMPKSGTTVWDTPLRVFHWLLVLSLLGSWVTSQYDVFQTTAHFYFGYLTLTLIIFRLIWGIFGSYNSRFITFLRRPKVLIRYLRGLDSLDNYPGHNPLGGWATVILLLLVLVQAITGLFISDDIIHDGPYHASVSNRTADLLASVHYLNFDFLLIACGTHIFAVILYQFIFGKDLILAMLTGKKRLHMPPKKDLGKHHIQQGMLCFIVASLATTLLIGLAPEPGVDF
jgi:cytochrome b